VRIDETAQKAIAGLWPLEVGKEISFRKNFQPTDGKAKARIRVKSTKSVTIAGVTRHVYVVTGETRAIKCRIFRARETADLRRCVGMTRTSRRLFITSSIGQTEGAETILSNTSWCVPGSRKKLK
jgi:hypothetical protein